MINNANGWPAFRNKIAVYCSGNNKNLLIVKLIRETTNLLQAVLQIFKYSAPYPRSFIPTMLRRYIVPYFAIAYKRTEWPLFIHLLVSKHCSNILLFVLLFRLYVAYFTWLHQLPASPPVSTRCGSGRRKEDIPGGSSCFLFFSDDFYFARLPEDEQLMVFPVMLNSLRRSGVGECHFGVRLPEDSEVLWPHAAVVRVIPF